MGKIQAYACLLTGPQIGSVMEQIGEAILQPHPGLITVPAQTGDI